MGKMINKQLISIYIMIDAIFRNYICLVIVINSVDREILALHNSPSYDNIFTSSLSNETWENLNSHSLP